MSMKSAPKRGPAASKLIDGRIRELGDWRGETLEKVRRLIKDADPEVVEEWKWMGTPVWSHGGDICTGETYKSVCASMPHDSPVDDRCRGLDR
jgi:hypothetical protein